MRLRRVEGRLRSPFSFGARSRSSCEPRTSTGLRLPFVSAGPAPDRSWLPAAKVLGRSWFGGALCGLVLALSASSASAQAAADTPASVRRIAEAGARTLALQRVVTAQPGRPDAPGWIEWERLRLELLALRGQDRELLDRVRGYGAPVAAQAAVAAVLYLHAARAAVRVGDGAEARRWLARGFAQAGAEVWSADPGAYRASRQTVIDAYLAEGNADAAFRSMLRFQQDFAPLRPEEVERFAAGLIAAARYGEAANWLTQLDQRSVHAALLRLRAGLLTPDAAAAQARAILAKGGDAGAATLLDAAGRMQNSRAAVIEAAEFGVAAAESEAGRQRGAGALWQAYAEAAQQAANQAQLLVGDDVAWLAHAARMQSSQPQVGRALLGHLAVTSANPKVRAQAQGQLVAGLRDARLGGVALALFDDAKRFPVEGLDVRTRHELGELAVEARRPELALAYWRSVPPPVSATMEQWQVRRLAVMADAGLEDEALALAGELTEGARPLTQEARRKLFDIALDAVARHRLKLAETLLRGLRARTQDAERIAVLGALARSYEAKGEPRLAAEAYLEIGTASAGSESDREALRAREAAAVNLVRAGLREDARGVYEWLARNAKDAAVRESAARVLRGL